MSPKILNAQGQPVDPATTGSCRLWRWLRGNWKTWVPIAISLLAIGISASTAWFAHGQKRIAESLARLHLDPTLSLDFDLPPDENPVVVIQNRSDVSAFSVSAGYSLYLFDPNGALQHAAKAGRYFQDQVMYEKELRPMKWVSAELLDVHHRADSVSVYVFWLRFYREQDMKEYNQRMLFFVRNRTAYAQEDFRHEKGYSRILHQIDAFVFPEQSLPPGTMKRLIQVWDQNTAEPDN